MRKEEHRVKCFCIKEDNCLWSIEKKEETKFSTEPEKYLTRPRKLLIKMLKKKLIRVN